MKASRSVQARVAAVLGRQRKAFTLLELLIVITIIAVLASAILSSYSKARENGWAARCKGNLHSLYQAALNYSSDHNQALPVAAPYETQDVLQNRYWEHEGWVNWIDPNNRVNGATSNLWIHQFGNDVHNRYAEPADPHPGPNASSTWPSTWFGGNGLFSIKNGTLWEYGYQQLGAYICPKFARSSVCGRSDAVRSYAMNRNVSECGMVSLPVEASRIILFAEMQPKSIFYPGKAGTAICGACADSWSATGGDGQLSAGNGSNRIVPDETIGCVHKIGNAYYGHVVFGDGHIEAISPVLNASGGVVSNRTFDACTGNY